MLIIKALIPITDCIPDIATEIYTSSFPYNERRNTTDLQNLWQINSHLTYNLIWNKKELCGILLCWNFESFIYLEHFAIKAEYRCKGLGRNALKKWMQQQSKPIILEVEPPTDTDSNRRIRFYDRLGFRLWNTDYMQPPYAADRQWVKLNLMSFGELDVEKSFEQIKRVLHTEVYGVEAK